MENKEKKIHVAKTEAEKIQVNSEYKFALVRGHIIANSELSTLIEIFTYRAGLMPLKYHNSASTMLFYPLNKALNSIEKIVNQNYMDVVSFSDEHKIDAVDVLRKITKIKTRSEPLYTDDGVLLNGVEEFWKQIGIHKPDMRIIAANLMTIMSGSSKHLMFNAIRIMMTAPNRYPVDLPPSCFSSVLGKGITYGENIVAGISAYNHDVCRVLPMDLVNRSIKNMEDWGKVNLHYSVLVGVADDTHKCIKLVDGIGSMSYYEVVGCITEKFMYSLRCVEYGPENMLNPIYSGDTSSTSEYIYRIKELVENSNSMVELEYDKNTISKYMKGKHDTYVYREREYIAENESKEIHNIYIKETMRLEDVIDVKVNAFRRFNLLIKKYGGFDTLGRLNDALTGKVYEHMMILEKGVEWSDRSGESPSSAFTGRMEDIAKAVMINPELCVSVDYITNIEHNIEYINITRNDIKCLITGIYGITFEGLRLSMYVSGNSADSELLKSFTLEENELFFGKLRKLGESLTWHLGNLLDPLKPIGATQNMTSVLSLRSTNEYNDWNAGIGRSSVNRLDYLDIIKIAYDKMAKTSADVSEMHDGYVKLLEKKQVK